jgi:drug/metabolite transporter (DMT)-like permease
MKSASTAPVLIAPVVPGIAAAAALGLSDVLAKVAVLSGSDVLTMLSIRSVMSLVLMAVWLRIEAPPAVGALARFIAMGVGLIFAALVFCLYKAIAAIDVPTAILSYFAYPLMTGLVAALLGLERLRWQGALCAVVAFIGLAIMIGAHPRGLALVGVAYALGAAVCRTAILLLTRAYLLDVDARLTTWYSLLASTPVFVAFSVGTLTYNPPQTAAGWLAIVGISVAITLGILLMFVSTVRIGAFRTALVMHLEPLTAMVLSAVLLAEIITPTQGVGSIIMLAALVAFQLWR